MIHSGLDFLLAVDSKTGEINWPHPVRFDNFQIEKGLPFYTPVQSFVRRYDREENGLESYMQFVFLDLETGKTAANVSIPFEYQNRYRMKWDPDKQQIQIDFATNQLNVNLDHLDDSPPRPLASLTNESSIPFEYHFCTSANR